MTHDPATHSLHSMLMQLHQDRKKLLRDLADAALMGKATEHIAIALSENRGETRAFLRFLQHEVVTRPAFLSEEVSRATFDDTERLASPLEQSEGLHEVPAGGSHSRHGSLARGLRLPPRGIST